jgi:hypothetical protein
MLKRKRKGRSLSQGLSHGAVDFAVEAAVAALNGQGKVRCQHRMMMEARPTSCDTDRLLYCCRHSVVLFFFSILCFESFLVPVVLSCWCRGIVFFSFVGFDVLFVIASCSAVVAV